ncbi:MAG: regulatory protein LuxR family [Actinomycetia bacterium]|nr:regulatory protein LuxR family [Actinomycetes bacterium]
MKILFDSEVLAGASTTLAPFPEKEGADEHTHAGGPGHTHQTMLGDAFERAAMPVLESLMEDLGDTSVRIVLADNRGRSLRRWVPQTSEHEVTANHWAPCPGSSAAAPINDPRVGRPLATLHLTSTTRGPSNVMVALAKRAVREIEDRLLDSAGASDRKLREYFLRARRSARGPLLVVSETLVMANSTAGGLVTDEDERLLRHYASSVAPGASLHVPVVVLANGTSTELRCEPILDRGVRIGAVVRLAPHSSPAHSRSILTAPRDKSAFGWASITDTERTVGQLVADGLTNREIGVRLFVSHHTVDSHLRSIFRKLSVNSRVELTRLVLEREVQPAH